MVCSTDRSKAVVPVLVLLFVSLWFILQSDFLYVFPCVILFLCFSVLLVLRLPRLGKRELILVLFVRLFGLCLFRFVGFLFLLASGKVCGLWLWHSLDFSLTLFASQGLSLLVAAGDVNDRESVAEGFPSYAVVWQKEQVGLMDLVLPADIKLWARDVPWGSEVDLPDGLLLQPSPGQIFRLAAAERFLMAACPLQ